MKPNTTLVVIVFCIHAVLCQTTSSPSNNTTTSQPNNTQTSNTTTKISLPPEDYKKLETAVTQIVGANIKPSPGMIELALKQGGAPQKMDDMMAYISLMQKLARKNNIKVPGVFGTPTPQEIDTYILENAITWHETKSAGPDPIPTTPPQTGNYAFQNNMQGQFDVHNMGTGNTYNQMQGNQQLDLFTLMTLNNALGSENSLFLI